MSPKGSAQKYSPGPPPREPATLTIPEIKELTDHFWTQFERSIIKWVIYAAGTAAALDIAHTLFLAACFLFRFDHF